MVRLLTCTVATVLLALPASGVLADVENDRHSFNFQVDLNAVATSSTLSSWLNGSVGKLRYDDSNDGLTASRWLAEYRGRLTPTLSAYAALDYQNDGSDGLDFTEAFLTWRPIPQSRNRHQWKFGAFYPRLSLENTGPGWSSPFTISSSAINTWIAEEIRAFGAEWSMQRQLGAVGSPHQLGLFASAYYGNDPGGSLLAWKGWSVHDRQSRFNDKLPLPPLPQIQPGGMFEQQSPWVEPFKEIDHDPGYYAGVEWRYSQRALVRFTRYDNRADPEILDSGQYGWINRFDHLAVQLSLPWELGLIAQWMKGETAMGPVVNGARVVDTDYRSHFVLLTRVQRGHRATIRYDNFDLTQNDRTPHDNNPDSGHAWTLAYRFEPSARWSVGVEWMAITTHHCGWAYYGFEPDATESQLHIQASFSLGRGAR